MDFVIYALIVIVIILLVKVHHLSNQIKTEQQEHSNAVNRNRAEINALAKKNAELSAQALESRQRISSQKAALMDLERKLDFYMNIEAASGNLNEHDTPVSGDLDPSKSPPESENGLQLDPEQAAVCKEMETTEKNFFITGKAGTGKSFLLEAFKHTTQKKFVVLAPTGIAALNVGGTTLHSAFGYYNLVNLHIDDISDETIRLKSEKKLVLKHVNTIIIDEISMVRADTFDKLDRILKTINHSDKPFGGKQILLFGDLFQLPPIAQPKEHEYLCDRYGGIHFFCAAAYNAAGFHFRELTMNHRQKEDAAYFELLNRVRDGSFTQEDILTLNSRVAQDHSIYDRFTTLLPTKAAVERSNRSHIQQLDSKEYIYHASIVKDKYPNQNHNLETLFPIVSTLCLKKGALIMMVSNDSEHRWVNGTLGIVANLSDSSISVAINKRTYTIQPSEFTEQEVIYECGKLIYEDVLSVLQYPLVPAYAVTIHKSQGQTYQNIVCDIENCFADGQAYVALSRCSSLNGLHLAQEISSSSIRVDKCVLDFYRKVSSMQPPASSSQ